MNVFKFFIYFEVVEIEMNRSWFECFFEKDVVGIGLIEIEFLKWEKVVIEVSILVKEYDVDVFVFLVSYLMIGSWNGFWFGF